VPPQAEARGEVAGGATLINAMEKDDAVVRLGGG
jgi:hypothetical protein